MNRPKGTKDVFGREQKIKNYIYETLTSAVKVNNFQKIETPIFEATEVFVRSVGESSDIVSKEMYSFIDKGERSLTLRPEGTAGVIRAVVENKLYTKLPLKLYYEGPMFRYENPQKGRQRQFTQFGVEYISDASPFADVEVILMANLILKSLGIKYVLKLNSLGDTNTKTDFSKALKNYFLPFKSQLTPESQNRLETNPLRILDDKIDSQKEFVKKAPKISDFYSEESKAYFAEVKNFLIKSKVDFEEDANLVRGLDYYTHTTFEFVSDSDNSGAQSTLIGGGHYQNLVKEFGGPELSGIGFGVGIERLINELANVSEEEIEDYPHIFVLNIAPTMQAETLAIVNMFRENGFITEWNLKPTKIQKAFDKAAESKAHVYVIAGEKELQKGQLTIKMHNQQFTVGIEEVVYEIDTHLQEEHGGASETN